MWLALFFGLLHHSGGDHSNAAIDRRAWKVVWSLNTPPKVRTFLQHTCSNILPTHDNLHAKKVQLDPTCLMCKQQRETVGHILWECPFARRVWALAKGKIQKSSASALNFFLLTQTMVQGEVLAESLREYRPKAGTELFLDLGGQWPPLDFQKKILVYIQYIIFSNLFQ